MVARPGMFCFAKGMTSCKGNDEHRSTNTECYSYQVTVTLNFIGLDTWISPFSNLSSATIDTEDGRSTNPTAKVSSEHSHEHSHKRSALMIQCAAAMRAGCMVATCFLQVSFRRSHREVNINQKAYMHDYRVIPKRFLIMEWCSSNKNLSSRAMGGRTFQTRSSETLHCTFSKGGACVASRFSNPMGHMDIFHGFPSRK